MSCLPNASGGNFIFSSAREIREDKMRKGGNTQGKESRNEMRQREKAEGKKMQRKEKKERRNQDRNDK